MSWFNWLSHADSFFSLCDNILYTSVTTVTVSDPQNKTTNSFYHENSSQAIHT